MPRFVTPAAVIAFIAAIACCTGCRSDDSRAASLYREFSGQRAFEHVARVVALGPRPSGSPELEQERLYIETQLHGFGWKVERQVFTDPTPHGPIQFINLIAHLDGTLPKESRALVCTHYDTKFFEAQKFVGANDGGSGTGALIELARVLALDPALARRFELVFFDGEEAIREFRVDSPPFDGLYGSRHYAGTLVTGGKPPQIKLGILWDMMGDRDLDITMPPNSPPKMAQGIFAAASTLGTRNHFSYFRGDILDDHTKLNAVGVPTIDLIDFDFPAWHTPADTLDKVSAQSLEIVGQATLYHLGRVVPTL